MPNAIDPQRDRRTLNVLLEMARLDALEARSPGDKHRARTQQNELLDDWLRVLGRPADVS